MYDNNLRAKNENFELKIESFNVYHIALVKENVIDLQTNSFHKDFKENSSKLSQGAQHLREKICQMCGNSTWENWKFKLGKKFSKQMNDKCFDLPVKVTETQIASFFDKLVFVVDTPDERKLNNILYVDMRKFYDRADAKLEVDHIIKELLDWCKKENQNG